MDNLIDLGDENVYDFNIKESDETSLLVPLPSTFQENHQSLSLNPSQSNSSNKCNFENDNLSRDPFEFNFNNAKLTKSTDLLCFNNEEPTTFINTEPNLKDELIDLNGLFVDNLKKNNCFEQKLQLLDGYFEKNIENSAKMIKHSVEKLIDFDVDQLNTKISEISDSDSTKSTPNSDKNSPYSNFLKNEKKKDKKLLKLSLQNALIQSPLTKSTLEDTSSPENSIFKEAARLAKQLSQMNLSSKSSSPRRKGDDSCDDIMDINPNWIDSESDMSMDLELLKIPMLEKIKDDIDADQFKLENEIQLDDCDETSSIKTLNEFNLNKNSIDINALKDKIQNHKRCSDINKKYKNIDTLISTLKDYVVRYDTNGTKAGEAEKLLESLSYLLKDNKGEKSDIDRLAKNNEVKTNVSKETIENNENKDYKPGTIVRQGTFDVDLENNKILENISNYETVTVDNEINDFEINKNASPDIMEQIGKILGGSENISVVQTNACASATPSSNPTYIVIMGTPSKNIVNQSNIQCEEKLNNEQNQVRRRSYSLSLPEKKTKGFESNSVNQVKNINNSSTETNLFKTPIRSGFLQRRNSVSSSTSRPSPITLSSRKSIYGQPIGILKNPNSPIRSSAISGTQNKFQTNLNEPNNSKTTKCMIQIQSDKNLNKLRVKSKENVSTKGPLKATVPMKSLLSAPTNQGQNSELSKRRNTFDAYSLASHKNRIAKTPPVACSTPVILASPLKSPIRNKISNSRVSKTPNRKSYSALLGVSTPSNLLSNRRKSFLDSSPKIFGKTRCSITQNTKVSHEIQKKNCNMKFQSSRIQSTLNNKENKKP